MKMFLRHASNQSMLLSSLLILLLNLSYTFSIPTTTLREYLVSDSEGDDEGIYLAMGPAFFGFYGYFGALAGMEDEIISGLGGEDRTEFAPSKSVLIERNILLGVSGASAGAMTAVTLAAGISPHRGGEFVSAIKLTDFADPVGLGGIFRGERSESLINDFLYSLSPIVTDNNTNSTDVAATKLPLQLEDSLIPVAVSAVDINPIISHPEPSWWQLMKSPSEFISSTYFPTEKVLTRGSMARASRASACFPFLFQPVGWIDDGYSLLIDGGIFDMAGYNGLAEIIRRTGSDEDKKRNPQLRVLNMAVGGFVTAPPGPEVMSKRLNVAVDSVFSLSIKGLPFCGPLTMKNGPLAIRAARRAIRAAMDRPIIATTSTSTVDGKQKIQHHFVLEIDASPFVDTLLD